MQSFVTSTGLSLPPVFPLFPIIEERPIMGPVMKILHLGNKINISVCPHSPKNLLNSMLKYAHSNSRVTMLSCKWV